jgi:hypothetical protein
MLKRTLSILTVAGILMACQPKKQADSSANETENIAFSERSENVKTLVQSDEGILRGIDLGVPKDVVKKKESAKLESEDADYAYFQSDLNDIEFFDIEYSFVEDTIFGIELEVFAGSDETAPLIYVEMEEYFDQKFGKGVYGLDDYQIWNTKTKDGKDVVLGMKFVIPLEEGSTPRVKVKSELANW